MKSKEKKKVTLSKRISQNIVVLIVALFLAAGLILGIVVRTSTRGIMINS